MSKTDPSLFHYQNTKELEGIITIHLDDYLSTRNEHFFKDIIPKIREKFTVGKECKTSFRYLGLDLKELKNFISLDQTHYIKLLDTINLRDRNLWIHDTLQSTIYKLIHISGQTRPNISFDVCHLVSNLKNSTLADIKHLNKVISHLKQSNISLRFQYLVKFQN